MNKKGFTQEEIKQLLKNKYVLRCSEKTITFTPEFKLKAVQWYEQDGLTPTEIFHKTGFDLNIIRTYRRKDCLARWRKVYHTKGEKGFYSQSRGKGGGRRKKQSTLKDLSSQEQIKYLQAQVAYLKAENDFLAKLRAKKKLNGRS